ncbi:MAG: ABC transporter ATP-binding protein [Chlamydiales bacterium]
MNTKETLLSVKKLKKHFQARGGTLRAIDDISFELFRGETLGLVGESGCGKSTLGRTLLKLEEATSGEVFFEGTEIMKLSQKEFKPLRRNIQMIFQDPYASLNPRMTTRDIIAEPLDIHTHASADERQERVEELLHLVGLHSSYACRFPHELSGGQRQRVGIARALALNPSFLICDEPISALDVSVQAQIVTLLKRLQSSLGLTYLFIAHDLAMVKYLSSRVAVMYLGHLVELAETESLYDTPLHPYTQALLSAIPIPDPKAERSRHRIVLKGEVPSAISPPTGCVFSSRCPYAKEICHRAKPEWQEVKKGHFAACHLLKKDS